MQYVKALIIKFVMITAVLWIVLELFGGVSFGNVITSSVILTGVSFVLGDLYVLPKLGNMTALIADFGLALVMIWALGAFMFPNPILGIGTLSLISAFSIGVGEAFFHLYMINKVFDEPVSSTDNAKDFSPKNDFQTEFGSDMGRKHDKKKNEEDS